MSFFVWVVRVIIYKGLHSCSILRLELPYIKTIPSLKQLSIIGRSFFIMMILLRGEEHHKQWEAM